MPGTSCQVESCERIGSAELTGLFGSAELTGLFGFAELTGLFGFAELRNSFPRNLLQGIVTSIPLQTLYPANA